jgi:hypothetical protein
MGGEISGFGRVVIGSLGGLAAVVSKYIGQDHAYILKWLDLAEHTKMKNLAIAYALLAPGLIFLGAFIAWASDEHHRMKLAAIAVSAPALITTWAGGATTTNKFVFDLIGTAVAQEPAAVTERGGKVSVSDGVKLFFGIGKDDDPKPDIVTGARTKVIVNGEASSRDAIRPGMTCTVIGPAGGQATAVECK